MFEKELLILIKERKIESSTPDSTLAKFIKSCLIAHTLATKENEAWYGIKLSVDNDIKNRLAKLSALEAMGVDNWEGYDTAMEIDNG